MLQETHAVYDAGGVIRKIFTGPDAEVRARALNIEIDGFRQKFAPGEEIPVELSDEYLEQVGEDEDGRFYWGADIA